MSFGIVNADITHAHFSRLLNGPGSFYPQGYLSSSELYSPFWLVESHGFMSCAGN